MSLAYFQAGFDTVPVRNGMIPPAQLDVVLPEVLTGHAGFVHFITSRQF